MKIDYVLDASAVLAYLQNEPGEAEVNAMLGAAAISAVNLAEVATKLRRTGETAAGVREDIDPLQLLVLPFDHDLPFITADLYSKTSHAGLSLGDRACLATAMKFGLTAVTTDRNWKIPRLGIKVRILR